MNCAPTHNHILPYLTVPFICTSRLDGREILPDIGSEPTGVQGAEPPAGVWGVPKEILFSFCRQRRQVMSGFQISPFDMSPGKCYIF